MSFRLADAEELGLLPARDHRGSEQLFHRSVLLWAIAKESTQDSRQMQAGGDGQCIGYWPEHDNNGRQFGSMANVFPALWAADGPAGSRKDGAYPIHDRGLGYDDRYRHLEAKGGFTDRLPLTPTLSGGGAAARKSAALLFPGVFPADGDETPRQSMGIAPVWGRPVPVGQSGVVVPGTVEGSLAALFMPTWDGVLVAQHRGYGTPEHIYSTRIADMEGLFGTNDGKALDMEDVAGLHSLVRVQRGPGATAAGPDLGTRALAAWLCTGARSARDEVGYGAVHARGDGGGASGDTAVREEAASATGTTVNRDGDVSAPPAEEENPNGVFVNAFASHEMGGPFHPGRDADAHSLGGTGRKGDAPWNALHFQLNTLWYEGPKFDAPLEFQRRFEPRGVTPTTGKPSRVHLTLDPTESHAWAGGRAQGLWRWHVNIPILVVPPREPPLPPGPPREPGPPGPGGPGGGGGGLPPPETPTPKRGLHGPTAPQSPRRSHGTPLELAFPAIAAKPYVYGTGETFDMRYTDGEWRDEDVERWGRLPIVARLEAFGKQLGAEHAEDTDGEPKYEGSRTAPGGWFLFPANVGMEDAGSSFAPPGKTVSDAFLAVLAQKGFFAAGTPDLATGGVKSGYRWTVASDGALVYESTDSAAAATERLAFTAAGLLALGGRTSSGVALKRVGNGHVEVRAGDDGVTGTLSAAVQQVVEDRLHVDADFTGFYVNRQAPSLSANRDRTEPDVDGTYAVTSLTSGQVDHGALAGLTDDDHTQYALLAGRAGGQELIGGTAASENLRLQSTSNATRGQVQAEDEVKLEDGLIAAGGTVDLGLGTTAGLRFKPRRMTNAEATTWFETAEDGEAVQLTDVAATDIWRVDP